jgi:hypothetical protein
MSEKSSADTSDTRRRIHTRAVECVSYLRPDGLWDIEGRLSDSKTHAVPLAEGSVVAAGEPYHGMWVRLTIDDDFVIRDVAVQMPNVPTSECRGAAPAYAKLIGERVAPGFSHKIKTLFGGAGGCTHLSELLLPIATTAFQTIPIGRAMIAPRDAHDVERIARSRRGLIGTCHALRVEGPIAQRYLKEEKLSG